MSQYESVAVSKSELKDGMLVTHRNGMKLEVKGKTVLHGLNGKGSAGVWLAHYNEDLTDVWGIKELDIVVVEQLMGE